MRARFLIACLLALPLAAKEAWVEVRSPHFRVQGNVSEAKAREMAWEFEEIRQVFQVMMPQLRVDPSKPMLIVALDGEDSMGSFLPDLWAEKGRRHPGGLFLAGYDADTALINTAAAANDQNPNHLVFHEYTHSIIHLNFTGTPLWLDEGLAEYFGGTQIGRSDVDVGRVSAHHLATLQQKSFIPIATLLAADHSSPLYNEQDRSGMFYSESMVLVHYLMSEPEAVQGKYLDRYIQALNATGDPTQAARQAFGDLKVFEDKLRSYARRQSYLARRMKPLGGPEAKDYQARPMSPAEALVLRGEFLARRRLPQGRQMLREAVAQEPGLASAHKALGMLAFQDGDPDAAEPELRQSAKLDPSDARTFFLLAMLGARKGLDPRADLETCVALNPAFPEAQAVLAKRYRSKGDYPKAIEHAQLAVQSDPSKLSYLETLGWILLDAGRFPEAREAAGRLQRFARSPIERQAAQQLLDAIAQADKPKKPIPPGTEIVLPED